MVGSLQGMCCTKFDHDLWIRVELYNVHCWQFGPSHYSDIHKTASCGASSGSPECVLASCSNYTKAHLWDHVCVFFLRNFSLDWSDLWYYWRRWSRRGYRNF